MNKNTTNRIPKKKRRLFFLALLAFTLIVLAGSLKIYAIYYVKQSSKSVAVVKGSYFTSNYLREGGAFDTVYNKARWTVEGECVFDIEIRNYANMLLVNDKDLEITYKLYFQLAENPGDGCTYKVFDNNNHELKILTYGSTSEGQGDIYETESLVLSGGEVKNNTINLKVNREKGTSQLVPVKVWAQIISPSYLKNDCALSANLLASIDAGEFTYTGKYEIMSDLDSTNWKDRLNEAAGFKYTVSTSGGNDGEDYTLKIAWNPALSLYQYDKNEKDEENAIKVTTKTNSSFTLVFFRGDSFDTEISKLDSVSEFNKLITISHIKD